MRAASIPREPKQKQKGILIPGPRAQTTSLLSFYRRKPIKSGQHRLQKWENGLHLLRSLEIFFVEPTSLGIWWDGEKVCV
jgi:hypothetical protein